MSLNSQLNQPALYEDMCPSLELLGAAWSTSECFIHFIRSWKRHQASVESSLITSDKLLRLLDGDFKRN